METFLYGAESGVHVFDLVKTKEALEEALEMLKNAAQEGKRIVFVGTKKQAREAVSDAAKSCGAYYVNERWLGGTITNFEMIKRSLEKLDKLRQDKKEGRFLEYTKKERLLIDREIERLERFFGGLESMNDKPDLLFIIDVKKEKGACLEAKRRGVATIGIVDSNSDPDLVDCAIPMNDDAVKAIECVTQLAAEAINQGKDKSNKKSATSQTKEEIK